jgi:acyl-CoA thioesterase
MHLFDHDISLVQLDRFLFKGVVSQAWCINNTPHGGYLMALVANAMLQVSGKKSTPIITANFAARCVPGEVEISVEKFSHSSQFERFQARVVQNGGEKIRALGTFTHLNGAAERRYETTAPEVAAVEECFEMPAMPGYTLFEQVSVHLDPACSGWLSGRWTEKSEHKGWFGFKNPRPYDISAILLAADAFPPPVFASQGMVAWVPTLELSVNIRSLPAGDRLKCVFRSRFISNGLLDEDGELWDETGELVAISRQISQFRRGRW